MKTLLACVMALGVLVGCEMFGGGDDDDNGGSRDIKSETRVQTSQIPPAVLQAFQRDQGGVPATNVTRKTGKQGVVTYDFAYTSGGQTRHAVYRQDGTRVSGG